MKCLQQRTISTSSYHIFEIHFEDQRQSNGMESFNCTIKARDKSCRGLKKKDTPSLPLFRAYYNHAGRHMSLKNRTPGDAAGIKIEERQDAHHHREHGVCRITACWMYCRILCVIIFGTHFRHDDPALPEHGKTCQSDIPCMIQTVFEGIIPSTPESEFEDQSP